MRTLVLDLNLITRIHDHDILFLKHIGESKIRHFKSKTIRQAHPIDTKFENEWPSHLSLTQTLQRMSQPRVITQI